jgi:hypothetical protein
VEVLLTAMVSEPRFDGAALPALVQQATTAIAAHASGPELGTDVLIAWVFRGHPYGHLVEGRSGSIGTLTASELQQFYADRYLRVATAACIAGPPDTLELSGLPARLYKDVTPRIVEPVEANRFLFVDGGADASIHLGRVVDFHPSDGAEVLVAAEVLKARIADALETDVEVAVGPGATVQPLLEVTVGHVADVPAALHAIDQVLAAKPADAPDGEAIRARLAAALAHGCTISRSLVGPDAADDLENPVDPASFSAMLASVWQPTGWKIVVVSPNVAQIAGSIGEGNAAAPVYAATDDLFR